MHDPATMTGTAQASGTPPRRRARNFQAPLFLACYALAGGLFIAAWFRSEGLVGPAQPVNWTAIATLIVFLVALPIASALTWPRRADGGDAVRGTLDDFGHTLRELRDQASLSDDARRVLNRQRERDLLRAAIEEDITAQDWDAAMVLVRELADRFGYRADAEEFRRRIDAERSETHRREVDDAIAHLDGLIVGRRWDQAAADAARITRLFPDSPRVQGLHRRVESARLGYKEDLERRFLLAAKEDRVDEAMDLLKELDAYLTEAEAGPFRETARGVIGKARENLGVQFKLAVRERRWDAAEDVGRRIIDEFPNSRMAGEVRTVLDGVRARSAGA